jgi:hypothetical protein
MKRKANQDLDFNFPELAGEIENFSNLKMDQVEEMILGIFKSNSEGGKKLLPINIQDIDFGGEDESILSNEEKKNKVFETIKDTKPKFKKHRVKKTGYGATNLPFGLNLGDTNYSHTNQSNHNNLNSLNNFNFNNFVTLAAQNGINLSELNENSLAALINDFNTLEQLNSGGCGDLIPNMVLNSSNLNNLSNLTGLNNLNNNNLNCFPNSAGLGNISLNVNNRNSVNIEPNTNDLTLNSAPPSLETILNQMNTPGQPVKIDNTTLTLLLLSSNGEFKEETLNTIMQTNNIKPDDILQSLKTIIYNPSLAQNGFHNFNNIVSSLNSFSNMDSTGGLLNLNSSIGNINSGTASHNLLNNFNLPVKNNPVGDPRNMSMHNSNNNTSNNFNTGNTSNSRNYGMQNILGNLDSTKMSGSLNLNNLVGNNNPHFQNNLNKYLPNNSANSINNLNKFNKNVTTQSNQIYDNSILSLKNLFPNNFNDTLGNIPILDSFQLKQSNNFNPSLLIDQLGEMPTESIEMLMNLINNPNLTMADMRNKQPNSVPQNNIMNPQNNSYSIKPSEDLIQLKSMSEVVKIVSKESEQGELKNAPETMNYLNLQETELFKLNQISQNENYSENLEKQLGSKENIINVEKEQNNCRIIHDPINNFNNLGNTDLKEQNVQNNSNEKEVIKNNLENIGNMFIPSDDFSINFLMNFLNNPSIQNANTSGLGQMFNLNIPNVSNQNNLSNLQNISQTQNFNVNSVGDFNNIFNLLETHLQPKENSNTDSIDDKTPPKTFSSLGNPSSNININNLNSLQPFDFFNNFNNLNNLQANFGNTTGTPQSNSNNMINSLMNQLLLPAANNNSSTSKLSSTDQNLFSNFSDLLGIDSLNNNFPQNLK